MLRQPGLLFLTTACFIAIASPVRAQIHVIASIKPVHSLVASVMLGVGEPLLLVQGAASPHTYSLKPSQAAALEKADVVFWIGPGLETFLEKPLEILATKAQAVSLLDVEGVNLLLPREGGAFETHGYEDAHAGNDGHGEADAHAWLDPRNAIIFATAIAKALSVADPANTPRYTANAKALATRLEALESEIAAMLSSVKGRRFIVFHDAYQYFENRFDMEAAGSVTVSPDVLPGAARISELRQKVKHLGVACVFSEPQFEPKLVSVITEGTATQTGVLDPEGGGTSLGTNPGPDQYFVLMRNLAGSLRDCLSKAG